MHLSRLEDLYSDCNWPRQNAASASWTNALYASRSLGLCVARSLNQRLALKHPHQRGDVAVVLREHRGELLAMGVGEAEALDADIGNPRLTGGVADLPIDPGAGIFAALGHRGEDDGARTFVTHPLHLELLALIGLEALPVDRGDVIGELPDEGSLLLRRDLLPVGAQNMLRHARHVE